MNRGCTLCWRRREDSSEYCAYHLTAQQNLLKAFRDWREAVEVEWVNFLVAVLARKESGEWVRDVVRHLLEKEKDES